MAIPFRALHWSPTRKALPCTVGNKLYPMDHNICPVHWTQVSKWNALKRLDGNLPDSQTAACVSNLVVPFQREPRNTHIHAHTVWVLSRGMDGLEKPEAKREPEKTDLSISCSSSRREEIWETYIPTVRRWRDLRSTQDARHIPSFRLSSIQGPIRDDFLAFDRYLNTCESLGW